MLVWVGSDNVSPGVVAVGMLRWRSSYHAPWSSARLCSWWPGVHCLGVFVFCFLVLRCFRCFLCKRKVKNDVTCMHMTQKRCCVWSRHGAEQIAGYSCPRTRVAILVLVTKKACLRGVLIHLGTPPAVSSNKKDTKQVGVSFDISYVLFAVRDTQLRASYDGSGTARTPPAGEGAITTQQHDLRKEMVQGGRLSVVRTGAQTCTKISFRFNSAIPFTLDLKTQQTSMHISLAQLASSIAHTQQAELAAGVSDTHCRACTYLKARKSYVRGGP